MVSVFVYKLRELPESYHLLSWPNSQTDSAVYTEFVRQQQGTLYYGLEACHGGFVIPVRVQRRPKPCSGEAVRSGSEIIICNVGDPIAMSCRGRTTASSPVSIKAGRLLRGSVRYCIF